MKDLDYSSLLFLDLVPQTVLSLFFHCNWQIMHLYLVISPVNAGSLHTSGRIS